MITVADARAAVGGVVPTELALEIQQAFVQLGAQQVAVRSSAIAEDGKTAAWAGQLETYLNTTGATLLEHVQDCWSSVRSLRAIAYRERLGLTEADMAVAVIVQRMVDAQIAGVAFSVHPITQDATQIVIEATEGLGDALVSGRVTPDMYILNKETGGLVHVEPAPQRIEPLMSQTMLTELSMLVVRIEMLFGFPVDVEWAYTDGEFLILQARPITTV